MGDDGASVSLDVSGAFTDADGDTLKYTASNLPGGLSIDEITGVISGTIDSDASLTDPYNVTITADDSEGGVVSGAFTWTVNNVIPTVGVLNDQTNDDSSTVSLDVKKRKKRRCK